MIVSFEYTNSKGEKHWHLVAPVSETPEHYMGICIDSYLKKVVDANDKDFKGEGHSFWATKDYFAILDQPDPTMNRYDIAMLMLAYWRAQTTAPVAPEVVQDHLRAFGSEIYYAKEPIEGADAEKTFQELVDEGKTVKGKVEDIPGWRNAFLEFKAIVNCFENRNPTQYATLKESRGNKTPIPNFDATWMNSFKNFKKEGIKDIGLEIGEDENH